MSDDILTFMKSIAAMDVSVRFEYNYEFGDDKRSGWSIHVDGCVIVQFANSPEEAWRAARDVMALRWVGSRVDDRNESRPKKTATFNFQCGECGNFFESKVPLRNKCDKCAS